MKSGLRLFAVLVLVVAFGAPAQAQDARPLETTLYHSMNDMIAAERARQERLAALKTFAAKRGRAEVPEARIEPAAGNTDREEEESLPPDSPSLPYYLRRLAQ